LLISAEALHELLGKPDVTVIDCRFTLGKPDDGLEAYMKAHIPGAYYFDLEKDLSGPVRDHGGRHPLPDPHELAAKLGAAGVGPGTRVVVYDAGEGMSARAWWLIRYLGHEHVAVLDGGFGAWLEAGYETSNEIPKPRHTQFPLSVHDDWIVSTETVERIVEGLEEGILVDARAAARYRGEVEPLDKKAGHIPGALNAPFQEGLTENGRWKDAEAQRARFEKVLSSGKPVVMYCGSGVTACNNLFALELAGVKGAKLYPGSWSDWISYSHHPVETNP
jgi:thiosulfate/3-mercaptopyruvate sulfurtransferase